jgi:hypothetical protein
MIPGELHLLKLHVEAVWSVRLPVLTHGDVDLLSGGQAPPWALYAARPEGGGEVRLWREDRDALDRAALLRRAEAEWLPEATGAIGEGVSREVALSQVAPPVLALDAAGHVARPIGGDERAMVEAFEPGSAAYFLDDVRRRPVFGVVIDGRLLSIAHSSRRTSQACELGIDTLPEARRRGYALAATVLWAAAVAAEGLLPLYSAFAENTASLALAAAAGYRPFAHGVTVEGPGR